MAEEKVNLGSFTKEEDVELLKQLDQYLELVNKHRNNNKISRLKFFSNAIKKELENKVLSNDFIELPKPFYFNMKDLMEEGTVKATSVKPIRELEETYILFNVPNNLDSWSKELNSYSFEGIQELHRGYYIFDYSNNIDFVFSYNMASEELEIVISNDRDIYFSPAQEEVKTKLLESYKEIYIDGDLLAAASYDGLIMFKYSEHKYYNLEREERLKEDKLFMENIERIEEYRLKK